MARSSTSFSVWRFILILDNIYVPNQFQDHIVNVKVKVMVANNSCLQVCAPLGHSLTYFCSYF